MRFLFVFILGYIFPSLLTAQVTPLFNSRLGLGITYAHQTASGNFKAFGLSDSSKTFTNGSGNSIGLQAFFEYPLTEKLNIHLGGSYSVNYLQFEYLENTTTEIDNIITPTVIGHYVETRMGLAGVQAGLSYEFLKRFLLSTNVRAEIPLSSSYNRWEQWLSPQDRGRFSNGRRIRNDVEASPIPNLQSILLGYTLSFRYELPMNSKKTFFIVPAIAYDGYVGNPVSDKDYSFSNIRGSISVMYHIPAFGKVATPIQPGLDVPTRTD